MAEVVAASSYAHAGRRLSGHPRADPNGQAVGAVEEGLPLWGQHLAAEVVAVARPSVDQHLVHRLAVAAVVVGQTSNLPRARARHRR